VREAFLRVSNSSFFYAILRAALILLTDLFSLIIKEFFMSQSRSFAPSTKAITEKFISTTSAKKALKLTTLFALFQSASSQPADNDWLAPYCSDNHPDARVILGIVGSLSLFYAFIYCLSSCLNSSRDALRLRNQHRDLESASTPTQQGERATLQIPMTSRNDYTQRKLQRYSVHNTSGTTSDTPSAAEKTTPSTTLRRTRSF